MPPREIVASSLNDARIFNGTIERVVLTMQPPPTIREFATNALAAIVALHDKALDRGLSDAKVLALEAQNAIIKLDTKENQP